MFLKRGPREDPVPEWSFVDTFAAADLTRAIESEACVPMCLRDAAKNYRRVAELDRDYAGRRLVGPAAETAARVVIGLYGHRRMVHAIQGPDAADALRPRIDALTDHVLASPEASARLREQAAYLTSPKQTLDVGWHVNTLHPKTEEGSIGHDILMLTAKITNYQLVRDQATRHDIEFFL